MNNQIFAVIQIILALILTVLILLQVKGTGLGSTFGGGGELSVYRTKRGLEKLLFNLTIVVSTLFLTISLLGLIL